MPANRAKLATPTQNVREPRLEVKIVDLIAPAIVNDFLNIVVEIRRDDVTVVPLEPRYFTFRLLDALVLCADLTMGTADEPTIIAAATYATARFFAQLGDQGSGPSRTVYTLRLMAS